MNDAIGEKDASPGYGEVTQANTTEQLAKPAKRQADTNWPFVAGDEGEPIIKRFFVAVAVMAGLKPGVKGLIETFQATPVKKGARIEENNQRNAGPDDNGEIEIVPGLRGRPAVFELVEII